MNTVPRVSVIIIFLNAERFLEEAIASVYAQTYAAWELLLVDDGSTDASAAIARRHAEAQPARVRYLAHPGQVNRGMSATRNLGSHHARGDLIAFLDADDVWLPEKLTRQVAILDAHPEAAMVYGPTQWWYSWTGKPEDQDRDFVHALGVAPNTIIQPPRLVERFLRNEGFSPCTCSMLVRRDTFASLGGFEEVFRGLYEDQAFCAKLCLEFSVLASSECWYRYRQHPDSACAVALTTGDARGARRFFLEWLTAYLTQREIKDRGLWRSLRAQLRAQRHPVLYPIVRRTHQLVRQVRGA